VVRFTEVSFFHKPSRTLLVTDAVVYVDKDPPACIPDEVRVCCMTCYVTWYMVLLGYCYVQLVAGH
jgi:hypothetical protein